MKLLIFISLFGGLLLASCGSSSSQKNASTQEVNPADTIYLIYVKNLKEIVFSLRWLLLT